MTEDQPQASHKKPLHFHELPVAIRTHIAKVQPVFPQDMDEMIIPNAERALEDEQRIGEFYDVIPTIFNARIIKANRFGINEFWDYDSFKEAHLALLKWREDNPDLEGEPEGWIRHKPSSRRRKDGDPDQETVRE